MGPLSPKNRNTVILLCFFLGLFGAHRFYLGKIITGIIMILTLGGLGIWVVVDFFIAIFGRYQDSKNLYVEKTYNTGMVVILIVCLCLGPLFLGTIAAVALPQYARYRTGAQDNAAESAYHNIMLAEEAYFAQKNVYTSNYDALDSDAALTKNPNVNYGRITLKYDKSTREPGYAFKVNHVAPGSTVYYIDSTSSDMVSRSKTGHLSESAW
jgi:TM2 domain-containing membrane protein YozV/type II secretory pathway pseudopilin PulG